MKRFTNMLLSALGILFLAGNLFITPYGYSETGIFEYDVEDSCSHIYGGAVAKIEWVDKKSIIFRPEIEHACWTKKGADLFVSDMIKTLDTGRVMFYIYDDSNSNVTLGYRTQVQITQCIIDRASKEREILINLNSGEIRCDIEKLDEYELNVIKVKTKWVLVVVKGSDFLIKANDEFTKITTFEDNNLEVINLAFLDKEPDIITDFKSAVFKKDDPISHVEDISREEAEKILRDFSSPEYEVKKDIQKGTIKDMKKGESGQFCLIVKKEGAETEYLIKEVPAQVEDLQEEANTQEDKDIHLKEEEADEEDIGVFVSEDELDDPELIEKYDEPDTSELIIQEDPITTPTDVSDEVDEDPIVLPEFPGPPF